MGDNGGPSYVYQFSLITCTFFSCGYFFTDRQADTKTDIWGY